MSRMFKEVTRTWNPVVGCPYLCKYCWARRLANTRLKHMYRDFTKPKFYPERLKKIPKKGTVFVCDMGDLFSNEVPDSWIRSVFQAIIDSGSRATFLFLTKNPIRYFKYIDLYRPNMVFGATIETDLWKIDHSEYSVYGGAPFPSTRLFYMWKLREKYDFLRLFISIEPIMNFSTNFLTKIQSIKPEFVYIGYDNYGHKLPEPSLEDTKELIQRLREEGIEVRVKEPLRKAWWEVERK